MPFVALRFDLGERDPAVVESICFLLGALAVTLTDRRDDPVLEPAPGEVRLWPATSMQALFAGDVEAGCVRGALAASLALDVNAIATDTLEDRRWEREWLADFHAARFGRRLWVCPRHEEVAQPGAAVVYLDPGLAFGTGSHATTALCLEWLDANLRPGAAVVDYGCGSGVLAIAAARLGAHRVYGYDIDPQALTAARENAAANGVADRVRIVDAADALPGGNDVVLANILAGTLCDLAIELGRLVRPAGELVMSGILEGHADEVTRAHAACFDTARSGSRDGWVCLVARRRAHA